jgi:hypothetical protein
MALGKGFARDGFGASWLGFEISVRWTSQPKEALRHHLVGPDDGEVGFVLRWKAALSAKVISSGWTRVVKMMQIWPTAIDYDVRRPAADEK